MVLRIKQAFGGWPEQLQRVGASVVIAQFGKIESLEGTARLGAFREAYGKLLDQLAAGGRRVVLMAPGTFEWAETDASALPDYTRAAKAIADERGLPWIDRERIAAAGQEPPPPQRVAAVREKHRLWYDYWRPANWKCLFGDDSRRIFSNAAAGLPSFKQEWESYPALIAAAEERIFKGELPNLPPAPVRTGSPDADITRELAAFEVLDGFEVNLFADERHGIANPLSVRWDPDGRMYVACSDTYPQIEPGVRPNDRIYRLIDLNGDGQADDSALFADGLNIPTGMEVGASGIYVGQNTELLFFDWRGNRKVLLRACLKIPLGPVFAQRAGWLGARREDTRQRSLTDEQRRQPALCAKTLRAVALLPLAFVGSTLTARCGDARVSTPRPAPKSLAAGPIAIFRQALSGFGNGDSHQTINSFVWSPGGELWFCQGDGIESRVETAFGVSSLFQAGVFRLRPRELRLDGLLDDFMGPGNPWGVAFDDFGQSFVADGAGGISYLTPGSIPVRRRLKLPEIGKEGGYCGIECLGASTLPAEMQGEFLIGDYKKNQVSRFAVTEDGAGFEVEWREPFLRSTHRNFRPVDVKLGPDGAIYVVDWYNPITCHQDDFYRHPTRDKTHGRIWRVARKGAALSVPSLTSAPEVKLIEALRSPERWTRLKAKQVLAGRGLKTVPEAFRDWAGRDLMEAVAALEWLDLPDRALLARLSKSEDHRARAYAARVAGRWGSRLPSPLALLEAAAADPHPRVRMEAVLACAAIPDSRSVLIAAAEAKEPPSSDFGGPRKAESK